MKILLTDVPGVGKSTVLARVRQQCNGNTHGIVAEEIRDEQSVRIGFAAVNTDGERRIFAHKTAITSDICVGGKYFVDVKAIDAFVVPEILKGCDDPHHLTFLDEIGRMQSFSPLFLESVRKLLDAPTHVLATIVSDPEPWSLEFKEHPGVKIIEVTTENRERLTKELCELFSQ